MSVPETIYTIPINEAFDSHEGCPICKIREMLEKNEVELILGPSMMEPDIRIETNKKGFCRRHYEKMFAMQKKLPLSLILESHMKELAARLDASAERQVKVISEKENSCYICDRQKRYADGIYENIFWLYDREEAFREKFATQKYFCLPHSRELLEKGKKKLGKKTYASLTDAVNEINNKYLEKMIGDLEWFAKKFDYRFSEEPWYDSRDAIERTIGFLTGENAGK